MAGNPDEFSLDSPPGDGISSVEFAKASDLLLVSSWDATLRLYDARANVQRHVFPQKAAVLDCAFGESDTCAWCGGLDASVAAVDLERGVPLPSLGAHTKPVRALEWAHAFGLLFSGSWDGTVGAWDPRNPTPHVASLPMPAKVFTMSMTDTRLVVGTAERHVLIYDVRKLSEPEQRRQSKLMHQTRCIRTFPTFNGYALTSIEGRVAIEYFEKSHESQAYAFKCHRVGNTVFPVNALAFHPTYGTFATGGCDGLVNIWDGGNKKRLCQLKPYPTSIASLSFNHDGSLLAVASSYTFEEGEKDHPKDEVVIHPVFDHEVKPKPKVAA